MSDIGCNGAGLTWFGLPVIQHVWQVLVYPDSSFLAEANRSTVKYGHCLPDLQMTWLLMRQPQNQSCEMCLVPQLDFSHQPHYKATISSPAHHCQGNSHAPFYSPLQ